MSLRTRVQRLVRQAAQRSLQPGKCLVCHGQHKVPVLRARDLPDGTYAYLDEPPQPCPGCGQGPKTRIVLCGDWKRDPTIPERLWPCRPLTGPQASQQNGQLFSSGGAPTG